MSAQTLGESSDWEGHNEPCFFCGEPTNKLAANPSKWPLAFCHRSEPGVVKWHHVGCVTKRLEENLTLSDLARLAAKHGYAVVPEEMNDEIEGAAAASYGKGFKQTYRAIIAAGRVK